MTSTASPHTPYQDSFLWTTIVFPSLILVAFNINFSFRPDTDIDMALLGSALFILWLFIITIRMLLSQRHGLMKKTMSLVLSLVCLWPTSIFLGWFPIGDYVHLAVTYPEYQAKIDLSPNARLAFDWGGFGFVSTASADRTLIYDPMDKLPQENKIKDNELRKTSHYFSGHHEYFRSWLITRCLFGHFYLVEDWHQ